MARRSLLPDDNTVRRVDRHSEAEQEAGSIVATEDPELIRQWAAQHRAEPATGEASVSGPATRDVHDGGAGIRFNFPAAAAFRPITWDEWLQNFTKNNLVFVYERDTPGKTPDGRYRLVPRQTLRATAE
jgi:hypothetical protein